MNNEQWFHHRQEMYDYTPAMAGYKRKRRGILKAIENLFVAVIVLMYLAVCADIAFFLVTRLQWSPPPIVIGWLVVTFFVTEGLAGMMFEEDFGLHNLEGYDPETGTVPELEAAGYDTKRFWPNPNHRTYRKPPRGKR